LGKISIRFSKKEGMKMKIEERVLITDPMGLNLRAACELAILANRFTSEITAKKGFKRVNARSVLELLTLAAPCGSELVVAINGNDANDVLNSFRFYFENGTSDFGTTANKKENSPSRPIVAGSEQSKKKWCEKI
jgi:phosphotransferase system HPr (HPr) family protein